VFKSIFRKHFIIYISALAVSFALLGAAMTTLFNRYFISQKAKTLTLQGQKILSILMPLYYSQNNLFRKAQQNLLLNEMSNFNYYMDTTCIIINDSQEVIASAGAPDLGTLLPTEGLEPLFEGSAITKQGTLGNIFSVQMLTVGLPIEINGKVYGAALMSTPMPKLEQTMLDIFIIMLICLALCALFTVGFIFFFLRSFSRPLREMNEAARVIAGGDFEKRIDPCSKDEVGQLAESFNNMAESLNKQEELRRAFISNISHDLRSPLTSARGFLQAIEDGTASEEKHGYYLRIVMDELDRLAKLADDILDLNSIQAPELKLEVSEFDLNGLVRKAARMFEKRIVDKKINLRLKFADDKNIVKADYDKILRVVYNLLDNAVKFSPPESEVSVETTVREKKVIVSVKDKGSGIDAENQKRVFERFFKADASRGEDVKGTGLGLAIVRAFLKAHGETVTLVSEEGKGSEFLFGLTLV
jgi:signal transduction histidine kinase